MIDEMPTSYFQVQHETPSIRKGKLPPLPQTMSIDSLPLKYCGPERRHVLHLNITKDSRMKSGTQLNRKMTTNELEETIPIKEPSMGGDNLSNPIVSRDVFPCGRGTTSEAQNVKML